MNQNNKPGSIENPLPSDTSAVEPKVKAGAIATYVVGAVLVAIVSAATDGNLVGDLPDWASALVAPLIPVLAQFAAAYSAAHQYRRNAAQAR